MTSRGRGAFIFGIPARLADLAPMARISPESTLESFLVVGVCADSGKFSADSRDVTRSNLSGTEMGTMFDECCADAAVDFERADDLRRSSLIAARC